MASNLLWSSMGTGAGAAGTVDHHPRRVVERFCGGPSLGRGVDGARPNPGIGAV